MGFQKEIRDGTLLGGGSVRTFTVNINKKLLDRINQQAIKFYGTDISFLRDWQVANLVQHILDNSLNDMSKDKVNLDKLFGVGKKDA